MSTEVEVQFAIEGEALPPASAFRLWASAALDDAPPAELAVRVVSTVEYYLSD